jgi:hypothetical protein
MTLHASYSYFLPGASVRYQALDNLLLLHSLEGQVGKEGGREGGREGEWAPCAILPTACL